MKFLRTCLTAAVVAACAVGSAQAALTSISAVDRNGSDTTPLTSTPLSDAVKAIFQATLTGVSTEDFESASPGAFTSMDLVFLGGSGSSLTATLSGGLPEILEVTAGETDSSGRFSVPSPLTTKLLVADAGSGAFEITFAQATAAFGFHAIDVGDFGGTMSLEILDKSGNVIDTIAAKNLTGTAANGSVLYLGVSSDAAATDFWGVRFLSTGGTSVDVFGFDNFTIAGRDQLVTDPPGTDVPEPGTLALLGLGLLAAGRRSLKRAR